MYLNFPIDCFLKDTKKHTPEEMLKKYKIVINYILLREVVRKNNRSLLTYFLDNFSINEHYIKALLKNSFKFNLDQSIHSFVSYTNWNASYEKNKVIISLMKNSHLIDNAKDIAITAWNTHKSIRNTLKQDNIDVYNYFIKLETRRKINEF